MKIVTIHRVVRIGKTSTGGNRFRFYTDTGSINSKSDAAFFHKDRNDLKELLKLEGETVQLKMFGTVILEIV